MNNQASGLEGTVSFKRRLKAGAWLTTRIGLSAAFIALTLGVGAVGAYSNFTGTSDTSSNNPTYTAATVSLAAITPTGANNRLVVGAVDLVPGDTIQRTVDIKNTGNTNAIDPTTPVKLTTKASSCIGTCASSVLDTDAINGLQLVIDKCSVAWTEVVAGAGYTYTCSGTTTSVLTTVPVTQTNVSLANITSTTATDNFLRVTLTLPSSAGNTFQGVTSRMEFAFNAQQRAATNK